MAATRTFYRQPHEVQVGVLLVIGGILAKSGAQSEQARLSLRQR
jgi:hypothetical protein